MSRSMTRRAITAVTRALAYEDQSEPATIEIPEDLSALSREDLDALETQATEAFNDMYGDGSGLDAGQVETLGALADGIDALRAEQGRRDQEEADRAAEAEALATRVGRPAAEGEETEGEEAPADGEALAAETAPEGEAVTASGTRRISLQGLQARRARVAQRPADRQEEEPQRTIRDVVFAASDVAGHSLGQGADWADVARITDRRLGAYNHRAYAAAAERGVKRREQFSVATVRRPYERMVTERTSNAEADEMIQAARREASLPGGSLVASGGWCAPSETLYDLCELESRDGILSVPEIGASRGGIQNTLGPTFQDIYTNTGFSYTEQEAIDGDWDGQGGGSKPCYQIQCPDFVDTRLNLDGVCITGGLLQARAYPELTQRILRGALVAHDHKMNGNFIGAQIAGSTAVALPADQAGATAPVLTAIELQVEHMRTVHRMSRNASIEAVFPFWVRGVIRSDLSRRLGVDLLDVSDQRINAWFTQRGIAAQFVYDWQDVGTTAASAFTQWSTEVQFLLYPAGTWVRAGADVITLDTIYDSTLLGTNDYTALFSEEGWAAIKTCQDSRVVTVPICPDGATHAGIDIDCDGTVVAAA